jgi:hypothetical protein
VSNALPEFRSPNTLRLEDFLRSRDTRRGEEAEGNPPPERDRWCPETLRELCLATGWLGERGTAIPGLAVGGALICSERMR